MEKLRHIALAVCVLASLAWCDAVGAKKDPPPATRHYYVAAEDVIWDFAPSGQNLVHCHPELAPCEIPAPWTNSHVFRKVRYIEYADRNFKNKKRQPEWLGVLGPVIRAEVGDRVIVHFCNRAASGAYGMHPRGFRYDKDGEGTHYTGANSGQPPGAGAEIQPGDCFDYTWIADADSSPGQGDPSSKVWWYHSHVNEPAETNAGLLGPIIITRRGLANSPADPSPSDVDREFVTAFFIFNELGGEQAGLMHAINGYIFGNLRGLVMRNGEKVRWHLLGMGERSGHAFAALPREDREGRCSRRRAQYRCHRATTMVTVEHAGGQPRRVALSLSRGRPYRRGHDHDLPDPSVSVAAVRSTRLGRADAMAAASLACSRRRVRCVSYATINRTSICALTPSSGPVLSVMASKADPNHRDGFDIPEIRAACRVRVRPPGSSRRTFLGGTRVSEEVVMSKSLKDWIEQDVTPVRDKPVSWLSQHYFFRDPSRPLFSDPSYFFAPADGIILYQKVVDPTDSLVQIKGQFYSLRDAIRDESYDKPSLVIGIFMTFYDVHVNRIPYRGRLSYKQLDPIDSYNYPMLDVEKSLLDQLRVDLDGAHYLQNNQRMLNTIVSSDIRVAYQVLQIADYDVGCVTHFQLRQNRPVEQTGSFSQVRFGSQVDLILPLVPHLEYVTTQQDGVHVEAGVDTLVSIKVPH